MICTTQALLQDVFVDGLVSSILMWRTSHTGHMQRPFLLCVSTDELWVNAWLWNIWDIYHMGTTFLCHFRSPYSDIWGLWQHDNGQCDLLKMLWVWRFVALFTVICPFFWMYLFVRNEVWWCGERFSTVLARMWLFPRITSCMKYHVMFIFQWFPAFLA